MKQLVSIIMPCYNAEHYISQSIESVLAQTYQNWELLITDDGSIDHSLDVIKEYCKKDNRIILAGFGKHQGTASARNVSIEAAKGRFVAFLDSDDLWYPEKLQKQIQFMLDNDVAFSYTCYEIIDESGKPTNKVIKDAGVVDYEKYLKNTIIGCGTVVLDKEKVGDFRAPNIRTSQDMALWLDIMKRGFRAYPLSEVLQKYRVTSNSATSNKVKAACDVWRVYRKIERLSMLKSMWCFSGYAFNAVKKRVS